MNSESWVGAGKRNREAFERLISETPSYIESPKNYGLDLNSMRILINYCASIDDERACKAIQAAFEMGMHSGYELATEEACIQAKKKAAIL